jgi:RNA polymerase sigma-70 factor, ECF subfamily
LQGPWLTTVFRRAPGTENPNGRMRAQMYPSPAWPRIASPGGAPSPTIQHARSVVLAPITSKRGPALRAIEGGVAGSRALATYRDEELLEGIARGDERIASEIYRRLLPAVEAALYRVMGRREAEHDDLVQSSFEQIILTLSQRRYAQACSLKTWASTLAAHVALKALRSRYRQRKLFDIKSDPAEVAELPSQVEDVEHSVGVRREIEQLRSFLSQLPPAQAEAVMLHDLMGHPLAEIASLTGVSVAAAQSRLVRGRKELAARLRELATGAVGHA